MLKRYFFQAVLLWGVCSGAVIANEGEGESLRVYTHGEGDFALFDGAEYHGPAMDLLRCSLNALKMPFVMHRSAMVRRERLFQAGSADIWLPSLVHGTEERRSRLVGPIGEMPLHWYSLKDRPIDFASESFKRTAKVTAFPGSTTERILRLQGFNNTVSGTDNENTVVLWLVEGRIDAFLSAQFESLLMPGALELFDQKIQQTLFRVLDVSFEVSPRYAAANPEFVPQFRRALSGCR